MWPFKKRKTYEEEFEDALLDSLSQDPKGMIWVFSMCDADKKIFATMLHLSSQTNEMEENPDNIDPDQAMARASVFANKEDSYLASVEKTAEDKTLSELITHRRNELWAEDGPIGKMAIRLKENAEKRQRL